MRYSIISLVCTEKRDRMAEGGRESLTIEKLVRALQEVCRVGQPPPGDRYRLELLIFNGDGT